jgi:hypothetical protein
MSDEMKFAKIAYIVPFQIGENNNREPVLLINSPKDKEISLGISLFFIGLIPGIVYSVSCTLRPDDESSDSLQYAVQKKFKVEDVLGLEGPSPTAVEIPITLKPPVLSDQYRIEATLNSENGTFSEAKWAKSFVEIRVEE